MTLAACSGSSSDAPAPASPAAAPAGSAVITGRIVLEGTAPPAQVIRLDGDPQCVTAAQGEVRRTEQVVLGPDHTLQNVFVYVKDGLPGALYPAPSAPVVLDQQKCRYLPRVIGVQVGQPLQIKNSDPFMHNVAANGAINEPFNLGQPLPMSSTRMFNTREVMVPFKCNVHAWMTAYVGVLEHPYFGTSGADGRFRIANLPAGTYTMEAWHEQFGTTTQQVTLAATETRDITFTFKAS
jgi:plastocyanin